MNLQAPPGAPLILQVAATGLLVAHISGGAVGIASGFATMALRKGGRLHRLAGNVFFVAMLTMAGVGAAVAPFLPSQQWSNTLAGTFTLYLLATGWAAARRKDGQIGRFEVAALFLGVGLAAAGVAGVWVNAHGGADAGDGASTDGLYLVSVLATICVAGDLHQILRGGLPHAARIARHLWRLSVALLVASASFFLGQPKFVPPLIRDTILVAVPVLAPLALMVFWLIRVRFPPWTRRARRRAPIGQAQPAST
jgi:uncharacterized membrane protein